MDFESIVITSVSTSIKDTNWNKKGSIAGGTTLYINISGHDLLAKNNSVKVGPYDCIIPDKNVSPNTIACITTEAFDPTRRYN